MSHAKQLKIVKIILTLIAFEFFGPIARDMGESHLLNPDWVGHSRFHLAWALALMFGVGSYVLYLIWGKQNNPAKSIYQAFYLLACNIGAFWVAAIFSPVYDGNIIIGRGDHHVKILGLNENVLVFVVLSAIWMGSFLYFHFRIAKQISGSGHVETEKS